MTQKVGWRWQMTNKGKHILYVDGKIGFVVKTDISKQETISELSQIPQDIKIKNDRRVHSRLHINQCNPR